MKVSFEEEKNQKINLICPFYRLQFVGGPKRGRERKEEEVEGIVQAKPQVSS